MFCKVNKPAYEELERKVKELERDIVVHKQAEQRSGRLNAVLNSLLNVSRIIRKFKDRKQLIEGVCDTLTNCGGYHNACIVLFDEAQNILLKAEAGTGDDLLKIIDKIEAREMIDCCRKASMPPDPLIIHNPRLIGPGGPISHNDGGRGAMAICLAYDAKVYGILTVSIPSRFRNEQEEHDLFTNLAHDIAYALHTIEVEEERRRSETVLRKTRDELERRVKERTKELEQLSSRLLRAQEEERKRIAGDLHDGIGQSLSAVKFMVETVLDQISGGEEVPAYDALKALIPMLQEASEEVRTIVTNLRPSILDDLGILATIGWLSRQFQAVVPGIRVEEYIDIREEDMPETLKTIIFRVLQEALNNIAKHSDANLVQIHLSKNEKRIELQINDNGYGFDMERLKSANSLKKGFGITGMKERTELSGGCFEIESALGSGCRIRASWNVCSICSIS